MDEQATPKPGVYDTPDGATESGSVDGAPKKLGVYDRPTGGAALVPQNLIWILLVVALVIAAAYFLF